MRPPGVNRLEEKKELTTFLQGHGDTHSAQRQFLISFQSEPQTGGAQIGQPAPAEDAFDGHDRSWR